ncbi:MAG: hypothetical protein LH606_02390 [Cytophagaceae bacterium]|nr:hypothetical protein [Cytophagaceae bacterium]
MKNPTYLGGDYSREFDFFRMEPLSASGPTNSIEPDSNTPPNESYEPVTNINASPALKPGESTFPTGSSNHSGIPQEPVGSLRMGADDEDALDPEGMDDDAQIVTSPDEDEEIERIEGIDAADPDAIDDEDIDEKTLDDEALNDDSTDSGDVGTPRGVGQS